MKSIHPRRHLRLLRKWWKDVFLYRIRLFKVRQNQIVRVRQLRRRVSKGGKIRVVFYANEPQKWSYESLYRVFERNPIFDPLIVVIPRYMVHTGKDRTRMKLAEQYTFYMKRGYHVEYGYENGNYLDISSFKPDVFFYLQLAEIPGVDDPLIVSKYALTCYCPYSFPLSDYRKEYLPIFHRLLFRYYVVHEWTRDRFEEYAKGNSRNCVVVGYPKLDVYFRGISTDVNTYWREPSKVKIIYAPHHSIKGSFFFSTFPANYQFILDYAKKTHDRTTWIFKPHPMLKMAVLSAGLMKENELEDYYQSWAEIGKVYDQGDYFDIFKSSDLMITDCASFLAEYLPSGKPLIRLINPKSNPLDKLGHCLSDCYYNVHNKEEFTRVFNELVIKGEDSLCMHRKQIADTLIDHHQIAANKIIQDLQEVLEYES